MISAIGGIPPIALIPQAEVLKLKLKDVIFNLVIPKLGEYGFSLVYSSSRCYRFENQISKLGMSITLPPRCPCYLFDEYLDCSNQKKRSFVVIDYSAVTPHGEQINVSAYMFESMMSIAGDFIYSSSNELEKKMIQMVEESISIVFPFMERFSKRYSFCDIPLELVDLLVEESEDMAQAIIERFGLSNNYREGYHDIEPLILALRGTDELQWKENFYNNAENLVSIVAYLGKCISAYSISSKWIWKSFSEIYTCEEAPESDKMLYFSARFKNDHIRKFNLFSLLCDLWNNPPFLKCRHIDQFMDDIIMLGK